MASSGQVTWRRAGRARRMALVAVRFGLAAALLGGCATTQQHEAGPAPAAVMLPRAGTGPQETDTWELPVGAREGERVRCIDRELQARNLNPYGDPQGTQYADGGPLGVTTVRARVAHVLRKRPDIGAACSRAPGEEGF